MPNENQWVSPARKRQIAEGTIPANIAELEAKEVADAVARILGTKPAADAQEAEAEQPELTKSEQRRADRKAAERAKRFGRA